jgi:two-component system phosphate regulon sensor histidine kinase PhoR
MRGRILLKFLASFLGVILVAILVMDFVAGRQFAMSSTEALRTGLQEKAGVLAAWIERAPPSDRQQWASQAAISAHARVTWIAPSGAVLADSEVRPEAMENHAGRPEFAAALSGGVGSSARFSHTVGSNFLYVAVPLPQGGALRVAYPLAELERSQAAMRRRILLGSGVAVLAAVLLAAVLAARLSSRLKRVVGFARAVAQGRLDTRLPVAGQDEVSEVMIALNLTADRLQESFARLAESSRQLEAVLEAMEEGVIAVDAGRRVSFANRAFLRLLGTDFEHAQAWPEMVEALDRALQTHAPITADLRHGSPPRWLKLSCSPMPGGAVAVLHDVTELERLEQVRKDFVANVSHELRTPLTSIQGYAETLLESDLVADQHGREFVEIIRKHAERMAKLTADLLALSRIELGRHEFHFEPLRVADLIQSAVQSLEQVARAREITLTAEPPSEDLRVTADGDAIHQVLWNLLDNALKYAPHGRVTVSAAGVRESVNFCIADTGIGISPEHLPRLFERFYRVDKARSRELGGTGLGLSIVKHIVRAHGGDVRVESEPGSGSRFYFSLPRAAGSAPVSPVSHPAAVTL